MQERTKLALKKFGITYAVLAFISITVAAIHFFARILRVAGNAQNASNTSAATLVSETYEGFVNYDGSLQPDTMTEHLFSASAVFMLYGAIAVLAILITLVAYLIKKATNPSPPDSDELL